MKSSNTIESYRQGLNNFRNYMASQCNIGIGKLSFNMVTADVIRDYLAHIIHNGVSLSTRNSRLTAIKQYMGYCAERKVELTQFYIPVSKIKHMTVRNKKGGWMTREAVQAVLAQPPGTKLGVRDRFLMLFLYGTGARISEVLNVKLKDIETLTKEPFVRLLGKGNKSRCVPVLDITMENFEYYSTLYHPHKNPDDFLFYTIVKEHKDKMSVANAERIVKKYGGEARKNCVAVPERMHPHIFRHCYGAHLYRMGFSLAVIAKLLDHESLDTTERYAETDVDMVNQAFMEMEKVERGLGKSTPHIKAWKEVDEETLARLCGLI
jgi:site-specific recombinase XerD